MLSKKFRVTLLGTGIPDPKPNRYGSGTLIEAGNQKLIFDCGRCVLQRLSETGIPLKEANKLFLTHLHSDHTVGIPDLWLTPWIFGRWEEPLYVWGPDGTKRMMSKLEEAFEFDLQIRPVHDLLPEAGAKIVAHDFREGVVYEKDGLRVTAFEVDHRPVRPSYGFRVDYRGKFVVVSGDTRVSENLLRYAKGADLLMHNVGAARPEDLLQSERYRRIMSLHSHPEETGELFARVNPRMAVYTHMVLFKVGIEDVLERTRKSYSGPLVIGEDLMAFDIGERVEVTRQSPEKVPEIVPEL
ncbi:MAG: MBL fold metallo-hydrolase [Deltaproteobacteria bacterium HGW-Deltaproteobacteria-21]|nr:MAG: MBL fold metallo-hydrolase [Deltaproteobacteria bacterium HGW-Deltaproteobacteria-21]